uniref:solute carrier family 22 member 21-like n=1 Tax=Ciona intestinalis TaxID=7719 RepID=UPI000EF47307|nr:solute carrier family 22 member 21-like [Ciona intestinalis]|eukprot:XP_026689466.1 solute carrier family 22 member 21-like [Ciona intestinalis]
MDQFAETLDKIGSFGKYQLFICGLLAFSTIPNGFLAMVPVFSQNTPQHYCRIPQLEELATQQNISRNSTEYQTWLDFSLPSEKHKKGVFAKSQCKRYSDIGFTWNGTSAIPMYTNNSNRVIIDCNHGWVYESDRTTLATEWDIVCEDAWLLPLTTTVYMFGVLLGSFLSGIFSDRYGRRPTFLLGTAAMYVCIGLNSFSVNFYMYIATFFGCGITALINYTAAFVLASEIIHVSKRSLIGSLENCGFSVGYMILAPIAYFIPGWRWLFRAQSLFGLIFIPYYWWLPESPLWLMCSGKVEEAMVIMREIARTNGKTVEDDDLKKSLLMVISIVYTVSETLMIAGAMTSKLFITGCFNIVYIFCCELFPTLMRNLSIGASSTAARVGAIASPYLIFLSQQTNYYSSYLIMASLGVSAAGLTLLLPETKTIPLPETIEDAEDLEKYTMCCSGGYTKSRTIIRQRSSVV